MRFVRHVVVIDAADPATVSQFWADLFGGRVVDEDPAFHCVIDADGNWVIGVQLAPDHSPPDWPSGGQQQLHLDLHTDAADDAHARATELGARLLQDTTNPSGGQGYRVYADPAGHPFCIGWGHPSAARLAEFLATLPNTSDS